ncbi:hypothetical protein [Xylophilus sp. GOD-11R]|nr:hypothetical protein [Xylophilus sp. GOD-11R]WPB58379.1 hypothetical protein R9X41_06970 [Xylophilus sp. GOD-11R]
MKVSLNDCFCFIGVLQGTRKIALDEKLPPLDDAEHPQETDP